MRARLFRHLLSAAERHFAFVARFAEIRALAALATRSFDVPAPKAKILTLRGYALFTAECMQRGPADPLRLYSEAYALGRRLRRLTGFRADADLERLIFFLYRNIGIDMSGSIRGDLIIHDCYFSTYYTPEQCAIMSNTDSGIIGGICGGGRLEFSERITEGCGRCRACLGAGRSIK